MKSNWFFSIVMILALGACDKQVDLEDPGLQPVLFEYEFTNYAWVYSHYVWMINGDGQIIGYKQPKQWNQDRLGLISKADLKSNLEQCDTVFGESDQSDMLNYYAKRYAFAEQKLDTGDIFMADAGIGVLYVYIWENDLQKYRKVVLASRGDLQLTNTHHDTRGAVNYLVGEGKKTDRFNWFD